MSNEPSFFKFIPQFDLYYCKDNICRSIDINKTQSHSNNKYRIYNNEYMVRDPMCFGKCNTILTNEYHHLSDPKILKMKSEINHNETLNKKNFSQNSEKNVIIISIIILVIIVILLLL